jgi:hypothetical protein
MGLNIVVEFGESAVAGKAPIGENSVRMRKSEPRRGMKWRLWIFVGSIFIEKNSPNRQREDLLRPAPAWFPDFLGEDRKCPV